MKDLDKFFSGKRKDFPILSTKVNNKDLVYFDSAATSQKPQVVIDSLFQYYTSINSNVHRGIHSLSEKATTEFEHVRDKVANFINSSRNEIVFTQGTTHSINQIAFGLDEYLQEGDEIVLTEMEHHANIVAWQEVAKKCKCNIKYISLKQDFTLDYQEAKKLITTKTKIVAFSHISNILGTLNDVKLLSSLAKKVGALSVIDGAQGIMHSHIDVRKLDCDFYIFSAHKLLGPTGVGILYGKKKSLKLLRALLYGGAQIKNVKKDNVTYLDVPYNLESGTPNIADVIAFGSALDYIEEIGMDKIVSYEEELTHYFISKTKELGDDFVLYGSLDSSQRVGVFSFSYSNIHPSDLAMLLDQYGIAVRSGQHCSEILHDEIKQDSTTRASLYFYNTKEEIDYFVASLKKIKEMM